MFFSIYRSEVFGGSFEGKISYSILFQNADVQRCRIVVHLCETVKTACESLRIKTHFRIEFCATAKAAHDIIY